MCNIAEALCTRSKGRIYKETGHHYALTLCSIGMARLITGIWLACNAGCLHFSMQHMLNLRVLPQGVPCSGESPRGVNGRVGLVIVAPTARRAPHLSAVDALRMLPPARNLHVVSHQRLQAAMHQFYHLTC